MSAPIQVPATLMGSTRKVDKSVSLRFVTALEVPNDVFSKMDELHMATGWLQFSEVPVTEVPKEPIPGDLKSHSQRLRGALFVLWEMVANKEKYPTFDSFYDINMNRFIEGVKNQIPE